ncbi:MAG: hypothetical protein U9N85_00125 [Bacteroidota bacterium]|nr:hypothetical protein [Bacteroidota bacterium]
MKRFILFFGIILLTSSFALAQKDCTFNGIELKGDVYIRNTIADIDVYIAEYDTYNSIAVRITQTPNVCGDWNIRNGIGDFSIKLVEYPGSADVVIVIKNMTRNEFINKYIK